MRKVMDTVSVDVLNQCREALLWMCFYGARFEWRINLQTKCLSPPRMWFSKAFAQQAEILGLTEWPQAQKILRRFVFHEFLEPYLPLWFDEALGAHIPRYKSHQRTLPIESV
ncbi:hypothetical protein A1O7_09293 [Cladophialophora yegresii CBS 114405]|uniref:Uncharacterized protein n=1 Tax=Cladophialophora yegresii CBS 114405 TaxID=1182544 RepID=W9VPA1_9EURO|nr:uncharacterized protein A1O7_09293 [Cladophialophora yegresii CBS 114405]EXJ53956.1 hypothetical protein A1O7_09293 [Cladophialophora yegresii CBS 114405]